MQKQFTEKDIRDIVQSEMIKNYRAGTPFVPPHQHNGNDNLRINNSNIIAGSVNSVGVEITSGTAIENTGIINGLFNPKQLYFYGIAKLSPLTSKASITGTAFLGKSYQLSGSSSALASTVKPTPNITQSNCCNFYHQSGGAWTPFVSADNINLAAILDESGTQVGSLQVTSWTNTTVTLQAPLDADWTIIGYIIIV